MYSSSKDHLKTAVDELKAFQRAYPADLNNNLIVQTVVQALEDKKTVIQNENLSADLVRQHIDPLIARLIANMDTSTSKTVGDCIYKAIIAICELHAFKGAQIISLGQPIKPEDRIVTSDRHEFAVRDIAKVLLNLPISRKWMNPRTQKQFHFRDIEAILRLASAKAVEKNDFLEAKRRARLGLTLHDISAMRMLRRLDARFLTEGFSLDYSSTWQVWAYLDDNTLIFTFSSTHPTIQIPFHSWPHAQIKSVIRAYLRKDSSNSQVMALRRIIPTLLEPRQETFTTKQKWYSLGDNVLVITIVVLATLGVAWLARSTNPTIGYVASFFLAVGYLGVIYKASFPPILISQAGLIKEFQNPKPIVDRIDKELYIAGRLRLFSLAQSLFVEDKYKEKEDQSGMQLRMRVGKGG